MVIERAALVILALVVPDKHKTPTPQVHRVDHLDDDRRGLPLLWGKHHIQGVLVMLLVELLQRFGISLVGNPISQGNEVRVLYRVCL